jgi:YggT family protein
MGAMTAIFVLADAIDAVKAFVQVFIGVYTLLVFVYVLTSWVKLPYSLAPLQRFLHDVCEPYLRLFRRILPPLGPLDLSPMVGVLVLIIVGRFATALLDRLH